MRNFLSKARGALLAAAMSVALVGLLIAPIAPAFAQAVPPGQRSFSPRSFSDQQVHYMRFAINFNSCNLPATAGSCSFKVGTLPYNAFVVRGYWQTFVAFNSTTTDTFGIGTVVPGVNLVAAGVSVHAITPGAPLTIVAANLGVAATGNGIAQSGTLGGFDVFVTLTYTGASPATAGTAMAVLEYFAPNDGSCTAVPLGATAPGC